MAQGLPAPATSSVTPNTGFRGRIRGPYRLDDRGLSLLTFLAPRSFNLGFVKQKEGPVYTKSHGLQSRGHSQPGPPQVQETKRQDHGHTAAAQKEPPPQGPEEPHQAPGHPSPHPFVDGVLVGRHARPDL